MRAQKILGACTSSTGRLSVGTGLPMAACCRGWRNRLLMRLSAVGCGAQADECGAAGWAEPVRLLAVLTTVVTKHHAAATCLPRFSRELIAHRFSRELTARRFSRQLIALVGCFLASNNRVPIAENLPSKPQPRVCSTAESNEPCLFMQCTSSRSHACRLATIVQVRFCSCAWLCNCHLCSSICSGDPSGPKHHLMPPCGITATSGHKRTSRRQPDLAANRGFICPLKRIQLYRVRFVAASPRIIELQVLRSFRA